MDSIENGTVCPSCDVDVEPHGHNLEWPDDGKALAVCPECGATLEVTENALDVS